MELKEFTEVVASAFENQESITPQTHFRQHDEWCSIVALTVLAWVRRKFKITLKASDLYACNTIEELFVLAKNRI